jgi:uncharacterized membrane protein
MTTDQTSRNTPSRMNLRSRGKPFHPTLVPYAIACFAGAFITDLAYWQTVNVMWETFSIWLITAGLVMAGLAVVAFLIDLIAGRRRTLTWPRAIGYPLAILLSLVNAFVHSRDGYTAVVPTGLILSGLVVLILLLTGWLSSVSVHRHRVGVVT